MDHLLPSVPRPSLRKAKQRRLIKRTDIQRDSDIRIKEGGIISVDVQLIALAAAALSVRRRATGEPHK